jgi:hypothetical protein
MFISYRVQVPNTQVGEVLAKSKGVHRKVESEGSLRQTLGLTNRNCIRGILYLGDVAKETKAPHFTEGNNVNAEAT